MRTTITRRIAQTTIHPVKVTFENGAPKTEPIEPIIVHGEITPEQAKRIVNKKFGKDGNVVVAKMVSEEKQYEISVDDFVKYAKVVEEKTENEAI